MQNKLTIKTNSRQIMWHTASLQTLKNDINCGIIAQEKIVK